VGGSRRLRAIVGRSRESRATAELELLTSTSDDVCELWNGHEIVRHVGVPDSQDIFVDTNLLKQVPPGPPNLSLNLTGIHLTRRELWTWAVVGICSQCCALVLPAIATYYWKWSNGNLPVSSYGYPCFLLDTSLMLSGVALCSYIIENSTTETELSASNLDTTQPHRVFGIQRGIRVGDQHYGTYMFVYPSKILVYRTSRRNVMDHR
jgi:hypothetical protein